MDFIELEVLAVNVVFQMCRLSIYGQILRVSRVALLSCPTVFSLLLLLLLYALLVLLVWQGPLGVRSAKRRHQSPEWTILSHSYCLIQGEIVRPQVLLDSLHPCSSRTSWWSPPVLRRGSSYDTPVYSGQNK